MERGLKLSDKSDLLKDPGHYRRTHLGKDCSSPQTVIEVEPIVIQIGQDVQSLKAEAKYRAMTGTCCELTWLRYLLRDLGVLHQEPALLYYDNKTALHIVANIVFHEWTRHIEMDCHYI
ncbi:hypothetical protein CK203_112699 [Vitis vinifera]|uniref:Retrovirus-related Pol polyprotein from transposon RE1 n=1 Tax=Vitis vinifera TaxID=29760 RepID=A0A438CD21_VITVI|nr:hypothetical protein CK203_112699 [Vitis vinifera]